MTNLRTLKNPLVGYDGGSLQKDVAHSYFKSESNAGSRGNMATLNTYASNNSINYKLKNEKLMEGYILFHFTDESTLAAPKTALKINFEQSFATVIKHLNFKLQNVLVVKLNKPTIEKDIVSWLVLFQKELLKIGVIANAAYSIGDCQDETISKYRLHADNTVDTARYAMSIFLYK